jgi:hypothetical protein
VKKTQQIDLKRQELDYLRHSINSTLGPSSNKQGLGFGMLLAAFVAGVIVERWGWRQIAQKALSVNRWMPLVAPALGPALAALYDHA